MNFHYRGKWYKGGNVGKIYKDTWLDLAFHLCGGIYGMADYLELNINTTRAWKRKGFFPPDRRGKFYAEQIEKKTGGLVKASRLFDECLEASNKIKAVKKRI